jgi:hypothetical protein
VQKQNEWNSRDLGYMGGPLNIGILLSLHVVSLEEIVSKSTLLATRPSRLAPKKCINKSIWLAIGGAPSMGTPRVPSGCQRN